MNFANSMIDRNCVVLVFLKSSFFSILEKCYNVMTFFNFFKK